jgi:hypothetical protein
MDPMLKIQTTVKRGNTQLAVTVLFYVTCAVIFASTLLNPYALFDPFDPLTNPVVGHKTYVPKPVESWSTDPETLALTSPVVVVLGLSSESHKPALGNGVVVANTNHNTSIILTCAHVLKFKPLPDDSFSTVPASEVRVGIFHNTFMVPPDGMPEYEERRARVILEDDEVDLALLEIVVPKPLMSYGFFKPSPDLQTWKRKRYYMFSIASYAPFAEPVVQKTHFHSGPVVPGQSGSAVFADGQLVGVVCRGSSIGSHVTYVDLISPFLARANL